MPVASVPRVALSILACLFVSVALGCGDDDGTPTDVGPDAPGSDAGDAGDAGDAADTADTEPPPAECTHTPGPPEMLEEPTIYTPRWAFEPWISKDISDGEDTETFVSGFESRDIPVGALVLDSPWETSYNTFVPNPERYPDFEEMVADLDSRSIRTVLWVTQMVNRTSFDAEFGGDLYEGPAPNYAEGRDCGYYVDDGRLYSWWKGTGAAVDFFDEGARQWWHAQQNALLDMGVDGWKLDFGESYIRRDTVMTEEGERSLQEYSEAYYRDFYAYAQSRVGREFVTMVRPYDQSYDFEGRFFARPEHAPVAWVGDNHRDWVGLVDALDHIFRSAAAGYVVVGSDIGGYLDRDELDLLAEIPFDLEVFQRWTALGALTPFMQLHGRQNLEPWAIDDPSGLTIALYRYWSKLHSALVPFFYSLSQEAYAGGDVIIRPIGAGPAEWAGDYRYMLGEALLVAPVIAPGDSRDIALPAGEWYDFWDPAGDVIAGGATLSAYDLGERDRIGVFVAAGAIIPMHVVDDSFGFGTDASDGALTIAAWPSSASTSFRLHDTDDAITTLSATAGEVSVSRALATTLFRIHTPTPPTVVTLDGSAVTLRADRAALDAASEGWLYETETRSLWVKIAPAAAVQTVRYSAP